MTYLQRVERLYMEILAREEHKRRGYDPNNFKWILGKTVYTNLAREAEIKAPIGKKPLLFGINILCDYENHDILELWERIGVDNEKL